MNTSISFQAISDLSSPRQDEELLIKRSDRVLLIYLAKASPNFAEEKDEFYIHCMRIMTLITCLTLLG